MHPRAILISVLVLQCASKTLASGGADDKAIDASVPKEVRDLAGSYAGEWTMFGIDDKGNVVRKMSWTDKVAATHPEIKGDRAFVSINDDMTFEGGRGKFKVTGSEGFFLKKDGTVGDHFAETFGSLHLMVSLADNVSSYAAPVSAQEIGMMGFPKDATGQHVLVKVTLKEDGVETHRVTRLSTVTWKDKESKERTLQFISLQGYHKRQQ
jgi:hypothetical protein